MAYRQRVTLNYRSTPQILRACQNLIHHNVKQIHKDLKTDNSDGDDVVVLEASNEETEALGVVNEIVDLVERRAINIAILPCYIGQTFNPDTLKRRFCKTKSPIIFKTVRVEPAERLYPLTFLVASVIAIPSANYHLCLSSKAVHGVIGSHVLLTPNFAGSDFFIDRFNCNVAQLLN